MSDDTKAENDAGAEAPVRTDVELPRDPDTIPTDLDLLSSTRDLAGEPSGFVDEDEGSTSAGSEPVPESDEPESVLAPVPSPPGGGFGVPAVIGWGAAVLGFVGILIVYFAVATPARNRVTELEGELVVARASVEETEGERDQLGVTVEKLEAEVRRLDRQTAELSTEAALTDQALMAMHATQTELEERLKDQIKKGSVLVEERDGELVVDLLDKIVFDSGAAELNESGKDVLKQVGETLKKVPDKVIQIAGHTDNLPISDKLLEQFPTNWELSTTRATNVVRFLQEEIKIPGKRLAAVGFAEYRPVAKNRSKAGRRKNRRIEVRLLPLLKKK